MVYEYLSHKKCDVAFCHERVIQGYTFDEIEKLPQIIAASSLSAKKKARNFQKNFKKNCLCFIRRSRVFKIIF